MLPRSGPDLSIWCTVRPMRVGIVAHELEGERTGVGRYLAGLLRGFAEIAPSGWRCGLFMNGPPFEDPLFEQRAIEPIFARRPAAGKVVLWEQLSLPGALSDWGAELVFSPSYSLPPGGRIPGVVTIHDLSFECLPEEFGWRQRWRRRLLARRACAKAARVLTDTETMRREVAKSYALDVERIGVVPLAVEERFRPAEPSEVADDRRILAELGVHPPYLLYLGALLDRRQPEAMVEAFSALSQQFTALSLVIAGPDRLRSPRRLRERMEKLGLADRVRRLGYVPEAAVSPLLRGAEATFYLSSYEGYGLPPLESLACGTPAIVASGLALDDLWPAYPYRVERLDAGSTEQVAQRILAASSETQERIKVEAAERLASLSWRRSAQRWIEELKRAQVRC